ncbi:MAG: hypothetical protein U0003_01015 [Vampirovibrionales bacterium]
MTLTLTSARTSLPQRPYALRPAPPSLSFAGWSNVQQGTIKLFDTINREYLYSFFALDIVALWLTRIVTGLVVGRQTVNLLENTSHPQSLSAQTPFQLWRNQLWANAQGLNWNNAWETFKREALTGPGCLLLPTLAYEAARRLSNNHTQEMAYPWLQRLHHAAQAALASPTASKGALTAPSWIKATLQEFFTPMASNDALASLRALPLNESLLNQTPRSVGGRPNSQTIRQLMAPYHSSKHLPTTFGHWLDQWMAHYAHRVHHELKSPDATRSHTRQSLHQIAQSHGNDLEAIWQGITRHQGNALQGLDKEGLLPLRLLESTRISHTAGQSPTLHLKGTLHTHCSIQEFTRALKNFSDYWLDLAPKTTPVSKSSLLTQSQQYVSRLVRIKGLATLAGMAIGGLWLYFLPRFVQNSKSYPAARLLNGSGQAVPNQTLASPLTSLQPPSHNPLLMAPVPMTPLFARRPTP